MTKDELEVILNTAYEAAHVKAEERSRKARKQKEGVA